MPVATGTAGQWVDVFWAPLPIASGTTYYLVFTSTDNNLAIGGSIANPYPNGQVYANPGYVAFPSYDYTFRTYADDAFGAIPEPATLLLLMSGLAAVCAFRRRSA